MSDRLPYEEHINRQLNDLPLPDENMAWEDMKRRLEEDDDRGIIPIWLRGCGLWSIVAIVSLGIAWWFIRPEKRWSGEQNKETSTTRSGENGVTKKTNDTAGSPVQNTSAERTTSGTPSVTNPDKDAATSGQKISDQKRKDENDDPDLTVALKNPESKNKKVARTGDSKKSVMVKVPGMSETQKGKAAKSQIQRKDVDDIVQSSGRRDSTNTNVVTKDRPVVAVPDSISPVKVPAKSIDTLKKINSADSVAKQDSLVKANETKKDSSKSKSILFSAGLGMHQLIPVGGQKLTPYNSAGRTGSLADYIPSVFARMYKNDKWFLQLEFRYGAPQSTKQFLYAQQSKHDSVGGVPFTTTTSYELRKTFYHQLPLTFNYFVTKDWSVGGGVVWNKFSSAVSEQTVNRKNNSTQADSLLSKEILSSKDDTASAFTRSLFTTSYFQAILETQYRWKRLSIGAKYSFGLQPYIKFTLPGGAPQQERNSSLQVFLRYELWKSKPKKLN